MRQRPRLPRRPRQHKLIMRAVTAKTAGVKLDLRIHADVGKKHVNFLRGKILKAHRIVRSELAHLSIALVDSAQMRTLHWQFFGDESVTDVMTFPIEKGIGEIVICPAVAMRESKHRGTSVRNELLLYALHGMLHLCGFDDRTPAQHAKMHAKEDEILTRIGIGPVYAAQRRSG
jgi:probable rRNA maturation factor